MKINYFLDTKQILFNFCYTFMKKTLVIGASVNPERYANIATKRLIQHGHEVVLLGIKEGFIDGISILSTKPQLVDIDTVTLYVGPKNQAEWIPYVVSLNPRRVIFNPGTENPAFEEALQKVGIDVEIACTLVLLSLKTF